MANSVDPDQMLFCILRHLLRVYTVCKAYLSQYLFAVKHIYFDTYIKNYEYILLFLHENKSNNKTCGCSSFYTSSIAFLICNHQFSKQATHKYGINMQASVRQSTHKYGINMQASFRQATHKYGINMQASVRQATHK